MSYARVWVNLILFFSHQAWFKECYPYFPDELEELREFFYQEVQNNKPLNSDESLKNSMHFTDTHNFGYEDSQQGVKTFDQYDNSQDVQNPQLSSEFLESDSSEIFALTSIDTTRTEKRRIQRCQQAKRHNDKLSKKIEKLRNILRCDENCTRLKVLDTAIQALEKRKQ